MHIAYPCKNTFSKIITKSQLTQKEVLNIHRLSQRNCPKMYPPLGTISLGQAVRTSWIRMRIMQRCIHQFSSRSTFVSRQVLLCGPPFEAAEAVPAAAHVLVLADFRFIVRKTGSAGFFIRGAEAAAATVNSKVLILLEKFEISYNLLDSFKMKNRLWHIWSHTHMVPGHLVPN